MKYLADVPDEEINKITHLNAMKHFRYDPFSVRPRESCTVGALRAEAADVDISLVSRARGQTVVGESGIVDLVDHVQGTQRRRLNGRQMSIDYVAGDDHVVTITINRPERANSMDAEHFFRLRCRLGALRRGR